MATASARLCGLLIDSGAEVRAQSSAGWTLCYLAAQEGDAIDVLWLLGEGVPPDHPSLDGATALQIACQRPRRRGGGALSHGALPLAPPGGSTTAGTHHSTWWRRRSTAATSPGGFARTRRARQRGGAAARAGAAPNDEDELGPPLASSAARTRRPPPPADDFAGEGDGGGWGWGAPAPPADDGGGGTSARRRDGRGGGGDGGGGGGGAPHWRGARGTRLHPLDFGAARTPPTIRDGPRSGWRRARASQRFEVLLAGGANADAADRHGVRPLWVACATGDVLAAAMLLRVRADPNAADGRGCRPSVSRRSAATKCVELLLGHAADANAADADGSTPLLLAASTVTARWCARWQAPAPTPAGRTPPD